MNGNGQLEAFELEDVFAEYDDDDEAMAEEILAEYDDDDEAMAEYDDDDEAVAEYDDDDEAYDAEDAEFVGALLGGAVPALAGAAIRGVGSLFRKNRGRSKSYRPGVKLPVGRGVTSATLRTPRGTARLRLPAAVVRRSEYLRAVRSLRAGITRNTKLVNRTQKDLHGVRKAANNAGRLAATNRTALARFRRGANRSLRNLRRTQKADITKLKQEQGSQATMNLLLSMMQQRQLQTQLTTHTHPGDNTVADNIQATSNMSLMLLPLMMQSGGSTGGDNNMMMMLMMVMMQQQQPATP